MNRLTRGPGCVKAPTTYYFCCRFNVSEGKSFIYFSAKLARRQIGSPTNWLADKLACRQIGLPPNCRVPDAQALSRLFRALLNNCDKSQPESCLIVSIGENLKPCSWPRVSNVKNFKSFEPGTTFAPLKDKMTTNSFKQKSDINKCKISNSY